MSERRKRHGTAGRPVPRRDPFQKILVATDFTQGASWAVERAARLPIAKGGKLIVTHVLPDGIPPKYRTKIMGEAQRSLEKLVHRASSAYRKAGRADVSVASILRAEKTYIQAHVEIIRLARIEMADIIVLGEHGRRVIRDLFLGSTAEKIIRQADIPVLIVKRKPSAPFERPLIAVDLEDTSRSTIRMALRSLGPEVANITVIHAYTPLYRDFAANRKLDAYAIGYRNEAMSGLRKLLELERGKACWEAKVKRGDPRSVIMGEIATHHADLIVLGTHGRSGLSRALVGSVAEYIARSATCDVLLSPPRRFSFALP